MPLVALIGNERTDSTLQIPVVGDLLQQFDPGLEALLIGFVVLIALQAIFVRMKTLYLTRVMHHSLDLIRQDFFNRLGAARWEVIQQTRVSDLNNMLTVESARVQIAASSVMTLLQSGVLLVTYFAIAALVSWQMALFAAAIGLGIFAVLFPIRRRATLFGRDLSVLYDEQNRTLLEFLTGLRVAKSFVAERAFGDQFWHRISQVRKHTLRFAAISSTGTLIFQIASVIAAASFVWVAVEWAGLDIGRLLVLLLIFMRLAPRFGAIQDSIQQLLSNLPAFDKLKAATKKFADAAEQEAEPQQVRPSFERVIRFENLSLSYASSSVPALDGIDFSIRAKRITALIGPSGSGKSTIADLAMGLLRPTEGRLLVDDTPITDANRRVWRASVAFVPQEPFLLHDTIAANLRIADPRAAEETLWAVLEQAKAQDFVSALPDGLGTVVGERGTRLSGGERQRIALARALLRSPELLILDEATSALDWDNQKKIAADIEKMRGQITILTIAHRPSMIRFADDVIAVEDGRCVETGSFAELAADPQSRLARMLDGEKADS